MPIDCRTSNRQMGCTKIEAYVDDLGLDEAKTALTSKLNLGVRWSATSATPATGSGG